MIPSIIESIQDEIRENCTNVDDYEGYVENCLLFNIKGGAEFYNCTEEQFQYCCKRALMSI
jgi:hypothetical protein